MTFKIIKNYHLPKHPETFNHMVIRINTNKG